MDKKESFGTILYVLVTKRVKFFIETICGFGTVIFVLIAKPETLQSRAREFLVLFSMY